MAIAAGRVPFLRLDRTGVAVVGAIYGWVMEPSVDDEAGHDDHHDDHPGPSEPEDASVDAPEEAAVVD